MSDQNFEKDIFELRNVLLNVFNNQSKNEDAEIYNTIRLKLVKDIPQEMIPDLIKKCQEIIRGKLPRRAASLVLDWAEIHQQELLADWELCQNDLTPKPIKPLE